LEDNKVKDWQRLLLAALIAVIMDGLTKLWVVQTLIPYQPVPVIGSAVRLTLGYNTGVAFSLFTNTGWLPALMSSLIVVGLLFWAVKALRTGELPSIAAWPVGFIVGGALANLVNRLIAGRVVDFIDAGLGTLRWPAFNLADSFIVVPIIWLILIRAKSTANDVPAGESE
jgi:signal peptidase II